MMAKPFLSVLLVVSVTAAVAPGLAQTQPPAPTRAPPTASPPKAKAAPPTGPSLVGNWSGQLNQEGSAAPYTFEISITAKGAETKYPSLDCMGQLTRVGQFKSYVFFFENIIKGRADKGGRCPDGTITVAPQADKIAVSWFGIVQDDTIAASGLLSRK